MIRMKLTKREYQILVLLANGYSSAQVAEELKISHQTIKNHLSSAYKKLDAANRQHAFLELGWLTPPLIIHVT